MAAWADNFRGHPSRAAWWISSLLGLLLVGGFALASPWASRGPVLCVFRLSTGMPCPACGLTRALAAAFQGDFESADRYHPFWPLVVGAGIILWLAWSLDTWFGTRISQRLALPLVGSLLLLLLGLWVVRMAAGALPH